MEQQHFMYRVTAARLAYQDSEGFWEFGGWRTDEEVEAINASIGDDEARVIRPMGTDSWLITLGRGREYFVEAMTHCPHCGYRVFVEETSPLGCCRDCVSVALDEAAAGF